MRKKENIGSERSVKETDDIKLTIDKSTDDEPEVKLAKRLVEDYGEFDPTLELKKYRFPTLELLKSYNQEGITIIAHEG